MISQLRSCLLTFFEVAFRKKKKEAIIVTVISFQDKSNWTTINNITNNYRFVTRNKLMNTYADIYTFHTMDKWIFQIWEWELKPRLSLLQTSGQVSQFQIPPVKKVKMQFIHVFSQVITVSIFLINAVKSFKFVGANFFVDCQFCKGLFTVGM